MFKCKPFEVIHRYRADGLITNKLNKEVELIRAQQEKVEENNTAEILRRQREKEKLKIQSRKKGPEKYQTGDLVMFKWDPPASGQSTKLEPKYRCPYEISKMLRYDR